MKRFFLTLLIFASFMPAITSQTINQASDKVGDVIDDLSSIVDEMKQTQEKIDTLESQLSEMEKNAEFSEKTIATQKLLLEEYKKKVDVLNAKYSEALGIADKLRSDLQLSQTINWIAIPVAILAIGFAAFEGYLIVKRENSKNGQ